MRMQTYALITPARNEAETIEGTIKSIVQQTVRPVVWVIVSDNSTDDTEAIVRAYAVRHAFIRLVVLKEDRDRDFASKVNAVNTGLAVIHDMDFDLIGNLDGDVTLEPDYYQRVLDLFARNPDLGVIGGVIMERVGGTFKKQMSNPQHTPGATQVFRRQCFEAIGGYLALKNGGEDSAADIMARMGGWRTRSFDPLRVYHHRRVGASLGGVLHARYHNGVIDYTLGKHPLFIMLKVLRRIHERPFLIGSFCHLMGYVRALLRREPQPVPSELIRYIRREPFRQFFGCR